VTAWGTLVVGIFLLLRVHPGALRPLPRKWVFGRLLRFSLPQTLTTTLLYTILWTDTVLLGRLRTAAEVGVYTIVQRLLSPAQTISTSTGQMFAPRIAAEDARGDRRVLAHMLKRLTYWNVALSAPVFGTLLLLPGPILRLFGPTYARAGTALAILAAGQLFNAATGPLGQVINMSGRPYLTMIDNAAVAGLNVAGCLLLIPRYGITGAACSTTAAITLVNLIKLVQVRAIFGIDPFSSELWPTLLAAAVAAVVAAPLAFIPPWPSALARVAASVPVLLLAYAHFFWSVAAAHDDKALLRGVVQRVRWASAAQSTATP
jgi:O-antigen/teichoic acid export membrane protein